MRHKRLNRRAEESESGHVMIGLALLLMILVCIGYIIGVYGKQIVSFIGDTVKKGFTKYVDAESLYTQASEANFERLNDELMAMLDNTKRTDHRIVPYTLGQLRLVGFNKDKLNGLNPACLGEELNDIKPDKCKNAACLCLCYMEETCECEAYPDVDYFITTPGQHRNFGENISLFSDPVTGDDAHCLMIKGSPNEKDKAKIVEIYNTWWRSNMVYLEKVQENGKTYVFFSRYQDVEFTDRLFGQCRRRDLTLENCGSVMSCPDYKTANLGCDWRYSCQNNVCADSGLGCNVVENPYANETEERQFCLDKEVSLGGLCTPGDPLESAPAEGKSGDLYWADRQGLCFRCIGLGQPDSDRWGWSQDSAINKDNCVTSI